MSQDIVCYDPDAARMGGKAREGGFEIDYLNPFTKNGYYWESFRVGWIISNAIIKKPVVVSKLKNG